MGKSSFVRRDEVHLLVPVADKDRMLLLAEKSVELEIASWRPVLWQRSMSVANKGLGSAFDRRIHARMIAALEQSGGAWLPDIFPGTDLAAVIEELPAGEGQRLLLDGKSDARFPEMSYAPLTIAVGPEGGVEAEERLLLISRGFSEVRIEGNTLRFDTAGIAGLTLGRMALARGRIEVPNE
jgi:16S rRNA (uracil1498-N3)-methyltransferase